MHFFRCNIIEYNIYISYVRVYICMYVCVCVCEIKEEKLTKKTTVNVNWCANVCSQLRSNFDRMQTHIHFFFLRFFSCSFFIFTLYLFYYWQQTVTSLAVMMSDVKLCAFRFFFIIEEKREWKKNERVNEWKRREKIESNTWRMSSAFCSNLNHKFDFLSKDILK